MLFLADVFQTSEDIVKMMHLTMLIALLPLYFFDGKATPLLFSHLGKTHGILQ